MQSARGRSPVRSRRYCLAIDALESRTLLTTLNWINAPGGAWGVPSNSSTHQLPGPNDDVTVQVPNRATITQLAGNDTVNSSTAGDPIAISGRSLRVAGNLGDTSTVTLSGGSR
jgi:hypothetical protein